MPDAIAALEEILPQLPDAIDRRRIGESLGRTTEELQGSERHIRRLSAIIDLSKHIRTEYGPDEPDPTQELIETARSLSRIMLAANSAEQLREVKDSYGDFKKDLVRAQRQMIERWAKVVDRDFRPLQAVGALLQKLGTSSDLGQRLHECGQRAIRSTQQTDAESLRETVLGLLSQRALLESERASMTSDPDIDAFLSAMAGGQAALALVTPRVRAWLEQQCAIENFVVTPRP